jgi:hypothetical protein
LSIDPTASGGSDVPQARVTLKQRISSGMTFTDIAAVNDPNTQIIRVSGRQSANPASALICCGRTTKRCRAGPM